jgi:hypothetical protein
MEIKVTIINSNKNYIKEFNTYGEAADWFEDRREEPSEENDGEQVEMSANDMPDEIPDASSIEDMPEDSVSSTDEGVIVDNTSYPETKTA